ncbi:MAG: glucosamine inositolphosphorylceramide transferase family protein [Candidatus Binataceae bacterium]
MKTELWRIGIVRRTLAEIALDPAPVDPGAIIWFPAQRPFAFIADPFALWEGGKLHVLAEHFDYRTKHGVIQYYSFGADLTLESHGEALRAPVHLSYPFLLRDQGQIYMVPEAYRSGRVTLYRARAFPNAWEPVADLLDEPAVDPTLVRHAGLWWMFYSRARARGDGTDELHIAIADQIAGPWRKHPGNPVHVSADSARPGGTPFVSAGVLYLPTQDSRNSYGEAVTILRAETLTPDVARFETVGRVSPAALGLSGFEGLHTLSACEDVTLLDVKTIDRSSGRLLVNLQRRLHRLRRRAGV